MRLPEYLANRLESGWDSADAFVLNLEAVRDDLRRPERSATVHYIEVYTQLGAVYCAGEDSEHYRAIAGTMFSALGRELPSRGSGTGFAQRVAEEWLGEIREIRASLASWQEWLARERRFDQALRVSSDFQLDRELITPVTELYAAIRGIEAVGDENVFRGECEGVQGVLQELRGVLETWLRRRAGAQRSADLSARYPSTAPFWWALMTEAVPGKDD